MVNRNPSVIASLLLHVILFADSESGHSRTDEEAYRLKYTMFLLRFHNKYSRVCIIRLDELADVTCYTVGSCTITKRHKVFILAMLERSILHDDERECGNVYSIVDFRLLQKS